MLFNLLALTLASILLEWKIISLLMKSKYKKFKGLGMNIRKKPTYSLIFSGLLSAVIAKVVHAEGTTVLIATVASTVFCSFAVYPLWNLCDKGIAMFSKKEVTA